MQNLINILPHVYEQSSELYQLNSWGCLYLKKDKKLDNSQFTSADIEKCNMHSNGVIYQETDINNSIG